MALLILQKGWLRVLGQKQMCHCGQAIKLFLKNVRLAKNKKHWVGLSVGFLVLSIFLFSVLSQWFTFQFMSVVSVSLDLAVTFVLLQLQQHLLYFFVAAICFLLFNKLIISHEAFQYFIFLFYSKINNFFMEIKKPPHC